QHSFDLPSRIEINPDVRDQCYDQQGPSDDPDRQDFFFDRFKKYVRLRVLVSFVADVAGLTASSDRRGQLLHDLLGPFPQYLRVLAMNAAKTKSKTGLKDRQPLGRMRPQRRLEVREKSRTAIPNVNARFVRQKHRSLPLFRKGQRAGVDHV